ncbi:MAG: phosphatidylserine decarboxylase family protein [Bdellovibrionales bacterium]|nr:phosphatidylserine decarboxylase family protein [Bdellovibrionales bacterium]
MKSTTTPKTKDLDSPLNLAPREPSLEEKVPSRMGICLEGWRFVGLAFLGAVGFFFWGGLVWGVIPALVTIWVAWFFRDPIRVIPEDEKSLVSPADGTILSVGTPEKSAWMQNEELSQYTRISIFMSIFNVHINRVPIKAVILKAKYNPGRFFSAFKEKASLENEQMAIWLKTTGHSTILMVQIAGLIARRIVCKLSPDETVEKGIKFGLIRFGSRMDVYLPKDQFRILVEKGQRVQGGSTVLAEYKS